MLKRTSTKPMRLNNMLRAVKRMHDDMLVIVKECESYPTSGIHTYANVAHHRINALKDQLEWVTSQKYKDLVKK